MTYTQTGGEGRRPRSTPEQLRGDIDRGLTGDKSGGFDPAAAPLGSDAEAGGAPFSPATLALDRAQQRAGRPDTATANAATPELQPDARLPRQRGLALSAAGGVIVALVLGAVLYAVL
jgi:hypothetical protein